MSGTPEWLDDKGKIIEHKYCQCFLEQHPLLSKGEDFFTTEGVVTDKDRLLRDVFDDIKEHLTCGLVTKRGLTSCLSSRKRRRVVLVCWPMWTRGRPR